jgi:hypothetical protein
MWETSAMTLLYGIWGGSAFQAAHLLILQILCEASCLYKGKVPSAEKCRNGTERPT